MIDELAIYETDRPAWLKAVAPKQAARIAGDGYNDAALAYAWAAMQRDYQTAVWALLPEAQRARIRKLREGK